MSTLKKASVLSRELANRLARRFTSLSVVESFDGSGNPVITVSDGTPAAGEQVAVVRVLEQASIGTNSVGLAQDSFGPHVVQVCLETSTIANVALLLEANKLKLMGEVMSLKAKVELYMSANTTVPAVGEMVSGNLKDTFQDLYFPFLNDM